MELQDLAESVRLEAESHILSKEAMRPILLQGMIRCAQEIHTWDYVEFKGQKPTPFKPGTSDKLLFLRIIDAHIDHIPLNYRHGGNARKLGTYLMNFYYQDYAGWQEHNLDAV